MELLDYCKYLAELIASGTLTEAMQREAELELMGIVSYHASF